MTDLPNYHALGRGFFIQALIDAVTIAAWTVLGVLLLMAVLSPFMFALLLIYVG